MRIMFSLEHIKSWSPDDFVIHRECFVRIWSQEHKAYWRWESAGYTEKAFEAGVWLFEDAFMATKHCGKEKQIFLDLLDPKEILIRLNPAIIKNIISGVVNLDLWIKTEGEDF